MSTESRLSKMEQKVEDLCQKVDDGFAGIEKKLDSMKDEFVSQHEFKPVKSIVYGMVTAVLLAVLGSAIHVIIR